MNKHQKHQLQAFRRVQGWLAAHPAVVAPDASTTTPIASPVAPAASDPITTQVTTLGGVVDRLTAHVVAQNDEQRIVAGRVAATRALRAQLLTKHMKPIATIARSVIPDAAEIAPELRSPKSGTDLEALLGAAEGMANATDRYQQVLVDHGMRPGAAQDLRDSAAALKASIDEKGQSRTRHIGATIGLRTEFSLGRRAVNLIGVAVEHRLENDPVLLGEWQAARKVLPRSTSSASSPTPAPAGGTVTPPVTAVATGTVQSAVPSAEVKAA